MAMRWVSTPSPASVAASGARRRSATEPSTEITAGVARAEEAPTDTIHLTSGAKNPDDAKTFLAYMASAEAQSKWNAAVGQLPTNKNSTVAADDPFISAGFTMLSEAYALAQFFDRDAPAEMAKAGMEGFQEFMVHPDRLDAILERLEKVRGSAYE